MGLRSLVDSTNQPFISSRSFVGNNCCPIAEFQARRNCEDLFIFLLLLLGLALLVGSRGGDLGPDTAIRGVEKRPKRIHVPPGLPSAHRGDERLI